MFSTNHFIWLGICAVMIGVLMFLSLKFKFSFKTATYTVGGISLSSELCKIFTHIYEPTAEGAEPGGVLGAGYLPFHLCSILIFLIFYLCIAKPSAKTETVKSFLVPVALLGGFIALFIPTSGVDFLKPFAYQSFLYHAGIFWYGLYLILTKQVKLGVRSYKMNLAILVCLLFVMLWVNSILQVYDTNFFYLVRPPMDGLPVLNLDNGWMVYFLSLIGVAFTAFTLLHLPFIISDIKAKKVPVCDNSKEDEKITVDIA